MSNRKLGRLFVRQRFTPLFDVPIKIENTDEPLGTHVFTLLEMQNDVASLRWNVISMPETFSSTSTGPTHLDAPVQGTTETIRPHLSLDDASADPKADLFWVSLHLENHAAIDGFTIGIGQLRSCRPALEVHRRERRRARRPAVEAATEEGSEPRGMARGPIPTVIAEKTGAVAGKRAEMTADDGVLVVKVSSHPAVDGARRSVTKYGKAFLPRRRAISLGRSRIGQRSRATAASPRPWSSARSPTTRAGLSLAFPSTNVLPHCVFSTA